MNETSLTKAHWSFWVIATVALIWNVMGAINFVVQMNPEMIDRYRESEQAIILGRPTWATVAFAIAMFGGTIGCLLLLLKKQAAFYVLIASLVGVVVTVIHSLTAANSLGPGEIAEFIVMPVVVAAFLVCYAKLVERRHWIGK